MLSTNQTFLAMNKHFVKIIGTYVAKNKLQAAIYQALKKVDHTLLEKKHLETFLNETQELVKELNQQFPRCTPVGVDISTHDEKMTLIVIRDVMHICVYKVMINA